jgi:hypothetical protein
VNSMLGSRFFVGLACLSLAGCPSSDDPLVSRDCAGFEDPRAAQWMPVPLNAAQSFANESGEARNLQVTDVKTDPPYRQTGYAADSTQLFCQRSSTLALTGPDNRIWTEWQFAKIEDRQGQPLAEQRLILAVTTVVVDQVGAPYSPIYYFGLENLTGPFNNGFDSGSGVTQAYYLTRTIGGVAYPDVLEASVQRSDRSYGPLSLPEADWVRIVIARGVGLVQYELRNGQIFTRQ